MNAIIAYERSKAKVAEWLKAQVDYESAIAPQNDLKDINDMSEIEMISDDTNNNQQKFSCISPYLTNLRQILKNCPKCSKSYDNSAKSLLCLLSHADKHFCFLCFELLEPNISDIFKHYEKSGHFSDCNKQFRLVNCPFPDCFNNDDSNKEYHCLTGLFDHIRDEHLKDLNFQQQSTSSAKDSFQPKRVQKTRVSNITDGSRSSGYCGSGDPLPGSCLVSPCSMTNFDSMQPRRDLQKFAEDNKPLTSLTESKENLNVLMMKDPTSERNKCSLCDKVFKHYAEEQNHKSREACSWMYGKWCIYCSCLFEEFTIMNCVLHLQSCQFQAAGISRSEGTE